MYKKRLIPVLFLKDGWMVRSEGFVFHQFIGDPISHVRRMVDWDVDELILLDIGEKEFSFQHQRIDYKYKPVSSLLEFINMIASECRIPLTFGGKINSIDDIKIRIQNGADKISINTLFYKNPNVIEEAAKIFGKQAIVASIDYKIIDSSPIVFCDRGRLNTKKSVEEWAIFVENCGAGEILLNSIDRDGNAMGYDLETINVISNKVKIPVIACGGAGRKEHFLSCYSNTSVSALAAGNIFHFKENEYPNSKKYLHSKMKNIRFRGEYE